MTKFEQEQLTLKSLKLKESLCCMKEIPSFCAKEKEHGFLSLLQQPVE